MQKIHRKDFTQMLEDEFQEILKLNATKGNEYAREEDVFADFNETATELGLTPIQALMVYATKHWRSINSYCRIEEVLSEPIEGRIRDLILYMLLLRGLIKAEVESLNPPGYTNVPHQIKRERYA